MLISVPTLKHPVASYAAGGDRGAEATAVDP